MAERRKRLTSSNFGTVINMKETTSVKNLVFQLLYSDPHGKAIQHGKDYEAVARNSFQEKFGKDVESCGIFIDDDLPYLAASPGK